ncbi:MAG: DUF1801 domain-containing protein, partial [Myxococcales bacterium]|nr:DUF1801 domain-containing protein [Myxococcales bacterium]
MPKQPAVERWLAKFEHPHMDAIQFLREAILSADPRVDECIKWQCPTFTYGGNMASLNPRAKAHVSLMFHTGALIPGQFPRLEGGAGTARYMRIADLDEAKKAKRELQAITRAWVELKAEVVEAGDGGATAVKKTASRKKASSKKTAASKKKKTAASAK